MATPDAVLLERWQLRRDADAFTELVQRYSGLVYSCCKRILGEQTLAEDIAQECFITLMQSRETVRASLGAWLHLIAVRRSIDHLRSDARRRKRENVFAESQDAAVVTDVSIDELLGWVDEAIAKLPDAYKTVVIGRFLESRSHAELARDLEMPESTVRYRVEKGVDRIRETLRKQGIAVALAAVTAALGRTVEAAPASLIARLGKLAVSGSVVAPSLVGVGAALWSKAAVAVLAIAVVGAGLWARSLITGNEQSAPTATAGKARSLSESATRGKGNTPTRNSLQGRQIALSAATPAADAKPVESFSIQGRVYDEKTGQGLAGVQLTVSPAGGGAVVRGPGPTDAEGRFLVKPLPDGTYSITVSDVKGYPDVTRSNWKSVTLKNGAPVSGVDFALQNGIRVAGIVTGTDRQPIAGADVWGGTPATPNPIKTQSDGNGQFELFMPELSDNLSLQAESGSAESAPKSGLALTDAGLDGIALSIDRPKTASMSGVVVDGNGTAMSGAQLHLMRKDPGVIRYGNHGDTEKDGRFQIGNLASADYSVVVTPKGTNVYSSSEEYLRIHLNPGEAATGIRIVYGEKGGMAIAGRVSDGAGKPISDARVLCYTEQGMENAHTDRDGKFLVTGLGNKSYTISVEHDEYSESSGTFAAGTMDAEIVLRGTGSFAGRVVRADTGAPLTEYSFAYVMGVIPSIDEMLYGSGQPIRSADGTFSIGKVRIGTFTVAAWAPGFAPELRQVTTEENKATDLEIRLAAVSPFEGTVVNQSGETVAGAAVYFVTGVSSDRIERAAAAHTDASGHFVLDSLLAQAQHVCAYHVGYGVGVIDARSEHKIVLAAEATIEGTVFQEGTPLDVAVDAFYKDAPHIPSSYVAPGADGKYRLTGLTPGLVTVSAVPNGLGHYVSKTFAIAGGQKLGVDIVFTRGTAQVSGVLHCAGETVAKAYLELQRRTGDVTETLRGTTGEDGRFQFDRVWAGNLALKITRTNPENPQEPHMQEVNLTVQEGLVLNQDIELPAQ